MVFEDPDEAGANDIFLTPSEAAALNVLATPEPLGPGVIVGDNNSPAWRGLTVTQHIDSNNISVQVSPVIPNNYIGISIYDVPYTGTTA